MPIIKSAKKRMRQTARRTELNKGTRTRVKTFTKKVISLSKSDAAEAEKLLPQAYKVIDTAAKKNIIHKNTANRRKSMLARTIARAHAGVVKKVAVKKPKKAVKPAAKKTSAKKTDK